MSNQDIRISGQNGAIVIGGAYGSGGTLVAAKSQWTFSNERQFYDASAFGDTNQQWRAGLRNAQGTYRGQYDASGDLLFAAAALGAQLLYLYADYGAAPASIGTYEVAHGSGFLDATVDCSLTAMTSVNGNFRAAANWVVFSG